MRVRITLLLAVLMVGILGAVAVPCARGVAAAHGRALFLQRLRETTRWAAVARSADDEEAGLALRDDLRRYAAARDVTVPTRST